MSKVKCSREIRFEIAKEYLNMPSTASISRWLKASLTQNSEELILDEAPEPSILICRIETPHCLKDTRMAAMWCAELRQGYKKPLRFYDTGSTFHASTFLRPRASLLEGFVMWNAFQCSKNVNVRQLRKKSTLWLGLDVLYCCH